MPLFIRHVRTMACLSATVLLAACGTQSDKTDGEVLVVPVAELGQACMASTDCIDELLCMTIPAGRVCVQSCRDASECTQANSQCSFVTGVDVGWCDTAADAENDPTGNDPTGNDPTENDPPDDEPPVDDPDVRASYPEGPFGIMVGDVMENHSMVDSDGAPITLGDLRSDASVKILLIFNGVTYCRGCMAKTAELTELYNELGDQGLLPVVALYENNDYAPAVDTDALRYKEMLELAFPVVADGDAVFHPYFSERAHPLILIVDAEDMTILYKRVHWRRDDVEAVIRQRLENE